MLASQWRYALDTQVREPHTPPDDGTYRGTVSVRLECGRIKPGQLGHDDGAERRQVMLNRVPH